MFTYIRRHISFLTAAAFAVVFGVQGASAESSVKFTSSSRLNEGNWVKVAVPNTGVCRISYDELRDMGFSAPEQVAVFGRGGQRLDSNFTDANGNPLYSDALDAVSTMHKNDALYFYAQGPQQMKYTEKGVYRVNNNVYTNDAYYFLTDSSSDAKFMPEANALVDTNAETTYNKALGYQLIEEDTQYPSGTGEEFFGWIITGAEGNKVTVPYKLPGSEKEDPVQVAYYGVAKITGPSFMQVSMTSEESTEGEETETVTEEIGSVGFYTINQDNIYSYANGLSVPSYVVGKLPGSEGNVTITNQYPNRTSFAALDYLVLTAPRNLAFQEGESSYIVYTPDYSAEKGTIAIASAPEDVVVWDVINSNDAVILPVAKNEEGRVFAAGLREGVNQGKLVAFSLSGDLLSIKGYEPVANQNIHALASEEMPVMLIITTPELREAAQNLAQVHRTHQNEHVVVATSDEIVNEFSQGTPDPMAYRAAARMFYDADNADKRTFKSVMLFGPMRLDNRGVVSELPKDKKLLICRESEQGDSGFTSYTILDNYGQLADYYGAEVSNNNYFLRKMDVAVGVVPADTPAIAQLYVNKVKKYLEDPEVATWMSNVVYTADGTNANEHQDECNRASNTWKSINNAFTPHKLFNNAYPESDVRKNFLKVVNNGALWSNYLGHASSLALNTILWDKGDYKKLTNDHLSFMFFGGCTITDYDRGGRGSGEEMVLLTDKGLVGAVIPNRTTLSVSNYTLMEDFIKSALLENPFAKNANNETDSTLLSSPRTFGEIARMAFNQNSRGNTNKLAYVLMCDPALVSLMPSADVVITSDGKEISEITPGTYIEVKGTVSSRKDQRLLDTYNGKVVVNLFAPEVTLPTHLAYDSEPMDVAHDNNVISTSVFEVVNGEFSGTLRIPESIGEEGSKLAIRMTAFDPSSRRTASGCLSVVGLPFDEEKSVADTESPVVEKFYVDRPEFSSGDAVSEKPVLYAVITDNFGMSYNNNSPKGNLALRIDGKLINSNVWQYISFSDEGRTLNLRFPQGEMSSGMHTAQIEAFDLAGNPCASTILFYVQKNDMPNSTIIEASSSLVRNEPATVKISTDSNSGYSIKTADLIITDALGNLVRMIENVGSEAEWNASDSEGARVAPGVYYAHCRFITEKGTAGVSEPVRLIVMRPSTAD